MIGIGANLKFQPTVTRHRSGASLEFLFGDNKSLAPYAGTAQITFTRASSATYFNALGVLTTAASNEARFDHDPVTGECKGLLIEEQRTNLLTYSEQFDNAAWVKTRASITANATVAPDGTQTGDKLVEDATSNNTHTVGESGVSVSTGVTYTTSFFVKSAERTQCRIVFSDTVTVFTAYFNLLTGTVINVTGAGATAAIAALGNGWYRCSVTATATTTSSSAYSQIRTAVSGSDATNGDGTSGLYIWGAQLEQGGFATSYIPTTSAQATRAADVAVISNLGPWFNSAEWTIFTELAIPQINSAVAWRAFELDDGSASVRGRCNGASNWVFDDTSTLSVGFGTGIATGTSRIAVSYKANDSAACANGGSVSADTAVTTLTNLNRLTIGGSSLVASRQVNGHIKRLCVYPRRLTNSELQGLTA